MQRWWQCQAVMMGRLGLTLHALDVGFASACEPFHAADRALGALTLARQRGRACSMGTVPHVELLGHIHAPRVVLVVADVGCGRV